MTMDQETAHEILTVLATKQGKLRLVTATHRCLDGFGANGKGIPSTEKELRACETYAAKNANPSYTNSLADPNHFVIHDVTEIQGPDERGRYTAVTAEGDMMIGYPAALLKRLTEAG